MFGPSLLGQTLQWHRAEDPPGAWAYAAEGEVAAELSWSRSEAAVRAEFDREVWRVRFAGTLLIRGVLQASDDSPRMVYAGSLRRGLVRADDGRGFVLYPGLDRETGPWIGFDDARGDGVLRIRGRVGGGRPWSEVAVTPDPANRGAFGPLLLLWGGLQLLQWRRPWLGILSSGVSEKAAQKAIEELALSVAF